jgi:hypothetical protein
VKAKNELLMMGKFKVGNGSQTQFGRMLGWKKSVTVAMVLRSNPLNVAFRRFLVGYNLWAWQHLVDKVVNVQLTDRIDIFLWSLKQNGQFAVQSMYRALIAHLLALYKNTL